MTDPAQRRDTLRPHPVRDHIVAIMRAYGKPISPTELSRITGGTLGSVAYHVRTLVAAGVAVLADEGRVRGAVEHFYTLTLADDEGTLTDPSHQLLTLCGALTVPGRDGGYPQPVALDDQARTELTAMVATLRPRVEKIALESTRRTSG